MQKNDYDEILLYASEYVRQSDLAFFSTGKDTYELANSSRKMTVRELRENAKQQIAVDKLAYIDGQKNLQAVANASTFSAASAVSYATTWANSYNPAYNYYSGHDCTNFVSQAWVAGNVSMRAPNLIPSGAYSTTDYWYHYYGYEPGALAPSTDITSSFNGVGDLYQYMANHETVSVGFAYSVSGLQIMARIGDIVQLSVSNGYYYHSIIITGGSVGNFTYSGHSIARNNEPVSNLSNGTFRIIHHN